MGSGDGGFSAWGHEYLSLGIEIQVAEGEGFSRGTGFLFDAIPVP